MIKWLATAAGVAVAVALVAMMPSTSAHSAGTGKPVLGLYDNSIRELHTGTAGLHQPGVVISYQAWEQNTARLWPWVQAEHQRGAETFIELATQGCTCGAVTVASVTAGRYDPYLRNIGRAVDALHYPVMITFDHEMNGTWYPWGAQAITPAQWVAAWRHVYTTIKTIATNAVMVWAPNTQAGARPVTPYWPGRSWADETGEDCYLAEPGQTWATQCAATVAAIHKLTPQPVELTETGVEQNPGVQRPPRIRAFLGAAWQAGVRMAAWFDRAGSYLWPAGQAALNAATTGAGGT